MYTALDSHSVKLLDSYYLTMVDYWIAIFLNNGRLLDSYYLAVVDYWIPIT